METLLVSGIEALKNPILVIDFAPDGVSIGIARQNQVNFVTYLPSQFRDFSEIFRTFLFQDPTLVADVKVCMLAIPENEGTFPGYPWTFDLSLVEQQFTRFIFEPFSREVCMGFFSSIASSQESTNLLLDSNQTETTNGLIKNIYGSVCSDFSISLVRVNPNKELLVGGQEEDGMEFSKVQVTSIKPELQGYLNYLSYRFGEKALLAERFFSPAGLVCWYQVLYQQKGLGRQLELVENQEPQVVQAGAPSDIAPLQLNRAPKSFVEDLQVDILASPYNPRPQDNFPQPSQDPSTLTFKTFFSKEPTYFQSLSWSTVLSYAESAQIDNDLSSVVLNGIVIPPEIITLAQEALNGWLSLFAEALGQLVVLMNMPGGVCLIGSFFQKLKTVLMKSCFGSQFTQSVQNANPKWKPGCSLITASVPTFYYLIHQAKEEF